MGRIRNVGDAQNVVLCLHLNFDGLEWLVNELESSSWGDKAVEELRSELESIRSELE